VDLIVAFESQTVRAAKAATAENSAFHRKEWVERGALFSYGADFRSVGEDAAQYVDRIFKGASPAALPVQQMLRFEFAINQKIAKTLGVTIPPSLLLRADKVIE
jgi:putative ABC transport system substrate-binding protein